MWEIPEKNLVPPEAPFLTAGCGHEVYEREHVYNWEKTTLCPDCMEEKFSSLSLDEKAFLLGSRFSVVETVKKRF